MPTPVRPSKFNHLTGTWDDGLDGTAPTAPTVPTAAPIPSYGSFAPYEDPNKILDTMRKIPTGFGSEDFSPMRGQLPKWGPGEFEEWKAGKLSGAGTAYGRARQQMHRQSQTGPASGQQTQINALAGLRRSTDFARVSNRDEDPAHMFQLESLYKLYGGR